ncbi:SOS response associated peptidase (SRAP) [Novosphingobium sp. PhB165]|nr:SOS response associated peptidase (SRAP) [Novosphingobium sp. PhB165]
MFSAVPSNGVDFAAKVYPKYTGLVIADGAVPTMTWGFPRRAVSKKTGKPLKPGATNNARDDKLRGNPVWRESFRDRSCLIPVSASAQAQSAAGRMTRTWYSLPGEDLVAVAEIW